MKIRTDFEVSQLTYPDCFMSRSMGWFYLTRISRMHVITVKVIL